MEPQLAPSRRIRHHAASVAALTALMALLAGCGTTKSNSRGVPIGDTKPHGSSLPDPHAPQKGWTALSTLEGKGAQIKDDTIKIPDSLRIYAVCSGKGMLNIALVDALGSQVKCGAHMSFAEYNNVHASATGKGILRVTPTGKPIAWRVQFESKT